MDTKGMVFSSLDFIFKFLPVFLLLYAVIPGRCKNFALFAGSLIFYFYGVREQPIYFVLFLGSIFVNYKFGALIGQCRKHSKKKRYLRAAVFYNFFWLVLFKYTGFFAGNFNAVLTAAGLDVKIPVPDWALPIGISFYTFQVVSYLVDVYRKTTIYENSAVNFGMYISMFPQLIAGPIVTYSSVRRQVRSRKHSLRKVEDGLREFTLGLGFKVLLANQIGRLWSEVGAIGYESISTPLAWLGLIAFSLQIYFDFYGYSLMAKGLGKLMGFCLPDNFRHPYMAVSMTEFWRKWHITLGSWFREYIYIPLGGNRKGVCRTYGNLLTVWLLTGFWHGAGWNFILWGFVLFGIISLEKTGLLRFLENHRVAGHIYMMLLIPLTWLLFAVTDMNQLGLYFWKLFPFFAPAGGAAAFAGDFLKYLKLYAVSLSAGLLFATDLPAKLYKKYKYTPVVAAVLLTIFWLCIFFMKKGAEDPFLYFRF